MQRLPVQRRGQARGNCKVTRSSCILQALVHEAEEKHEGRGGADASFYEITIASQDQPKLLCRLSETLVSNNRPHACTDLRSGVVERFYS